MNVKDLEQRMISKQMEVFEEHINTAMKENFRSVSIKLPSNFEVDIVQKCVNELRSNGFVAEFYRVSNEEGLHTFLYLDWDQTRQLNQNVYNRIEDLNDRNVTSVYLSRYNGSQYVLATRRVSGTVRGIIRGYLIPSGLSDMDQKELLDRMRDENENINIFRDESEMFESFLQLMGIKDVSDTEMETDLLLFGTFSADEAMFVDRFNYHLINKFEQETDDDIESDVIQFLVEDVTSVAHLIGYSVDEYAKYNGLPTNYIDPDDLTYMVFKHYISRPLVSIYNG